ncbi:TraU family protein, partial [Photobacterium damselae subsp. damselae]|nr:TraU family protein [Photobacterium damselae subsp. damselae]
MKLNKVLSLTIGLIAGGISISANADDFTLGKCQDADVLSGSLITDVPWSALYPIRLAGIRISPKGDGAPSEATRDSMCACEDDLGIYVPGVTQSMYEPARLIELVRQPNCHMVLGGAVIETTNGRKRGKIGTSTETIENQTGFWHYHYYSYPLLLMLELLVPNRCGDGIVGMDLMYLSELDVTWSDSEIAFFANPEAAIFNNPISIAACAGDAAAAATGNPIDGMFWCAGAWGQMYPLTGYTQQNTSIPTKTSLLATRSVAALHRRLLAYKTMGDDAMCDSVIFPTIPKSQYKMNMMYPIPERDDTHKIGELSMKWGEWRTMPSKEDAVYMLWRWNDCC